MAFDILLSDIDGTLVDSNTLHADAWRRALEHFGIQVGLDEAWSQIGKGGDQLIPVFVAEADRERLEKPLETYRSELFRREYLPRVTPFPQAKALLERVKAQGMRVALASSANEKDLKEYKRIVDIEAIVDEESSSADAEQSKPAPDIFAAALKKAGVSAEQSIALGDTPYDAEAAGKLGIPIIGLTCGGWKRDDLLGAGCIEVYRDASDLLARFDQSALGR